MILNPDLTKQAQEVIFSRKLNKPVHPNLTFNNSQVSQTESQKHLGLILDGKLNLAKILGCFREDLENYGSYSFDFNLFFQDFHCSLFIKLSLDHILIMGTLFMIKLSMRHFTENLNLFNIPLV